ncbi:LacI family DNA-binding transcriptional regulator [Alkalispirochaeta alkalica]|uniref:LacI family DNA-binding transcriptional regulator n=1 Tax=Alkalispirochaeta alkalica TaxID=46356 RepID=UPI0003665B66|nr:LacI family DNA-binding transcriptional regulator [Alkalispirochaeta alkalica]
MNIKELARRAGVSISTISRVINNSAYVSPEIRERVEAIIAETGYRPNSLAKDLLRNKTDTIGVLLPRIDLPTFAAMFEGVTDVLNQNGYNILLANTRDQHDDELKYFQLFYEKRVDGVIYFATGITEEHVRLVKQIRMPLVVLGHSGEAFSCSAVRLENFGAAKAMVQHLLELGHRRIGCIAVPDHDVDISTHRKQGYRSALEEAGIDFDERLVSIGDFEYPWGERGAAALMSLPDTADRPTAIFCITDRLAVAASGWLQRSGYRVPQDVSVACIDDPVLLSYTQPRVTTMSFDYHRAGATAGQMLINRINGTQAEPRETFMPFSFRLRDSTGPCPSG